MTDTPQATGTRRLFSLAAVLYQPGPSGVLSIVNAHSFRIAEDGEDAVVGRFVQWIMSENPGYSLSGKVSVLEITRADLAAMEAANAA